MKKLFAAAIVLSAFALSADLPVNGDFGTGELSPWQCPQQAGGKVRLFRVVREDGKPVLESRGDENNKFNAFIALIQTLQVTPSALKRNCTFQRLVFPPAGILSSAT